MIKKSIIFACLLLLTPVFARSESSGSKWREYFGLESKEDTVKASEDEIPAPKRERKPRRKRTIDNPEGMVDLVDSPTSNVLDYGGFRLNFRLYTAGGVQNHISFGVFKRLNIGATWDIEKLLGSEDPRTVSPTLFAKFRIYDGGNVLPSFAVGYDGQGRFYDRTVDEYSERERGLFAAFTREIYWPALQIHFGANIAKFKDAEVYGFTGLSYQIEDKVALLMEYDNIRKGPNNRWNAGVRFFPVPSLAVDFAFRRIASKYDKERIIRINWVGAF
ncbi:MAG: hypothetical protein A2901_01225 [Elusimicrobia bacterium RIFCSPLOWO2_01_FULL_54_10]|nr:MAG: hypothetical protein A2901_01225 [Elusimicrobia bacterium RIFCSPLOWO2_01_FULL_54_10]